MEGASPSAPKSILRGPPTPPTVTASLGAAYSSAGDIGSAAKQNQRRVRFHVRDWKGGEGGAMSSFRCDARAHTTNAHTRLEESSV